MPAIILMFAGMARSYRSLAERMGSLTDRE